MRCSSLIERNRFLVSATAGGTLAAVSVALAPSILVALGIIKTVGLIISSCILAGIIGNHFLQKKVQQLAIVKKDKTPTGTVQPNHTINVVVEVVAVKPPQNVNQQKKVEVAKPSLPIATAAPATTSVANLVKTDISFIIPPSAEEERKKAIEVTQDVDARKEERKKAVRHIPAPIAVKLAPINFLDITVPVSASPVTTPASPVKTPPEVVVEQDTPKVVVIRKAPTPDAVPTEVPSSPIDTVAQPLTLQARMESFKQQSPGFKLFIESLFKVHGSVINQLWPMLEGQFAQRVTQLEESGIGEELQKLFAATHPVATQENSFELALASDLLFPIALRSLFSVSASVKKNASLQFKVENGQHIIAISGLSLKILSKTELEIPLKEVRIDPTTKMVAIDSALANEVAFALPEEGANQTTLLFRENFSIQFSKEKGENVVKIQNFAVNVVMKNICNKGIDLDNTFPILEYRKNVKTASYTVVRGYLEGFIGKLKEAVIVPAASIFEELIAQKIAEKAKIQADIKLSNYARTVFITPKVVEVVA